MGRVKITGPLPRYVEAVTPDELEEALESVEGGGGGAGFTAADVTAVSALLVREGYYISSGGAAGSVEADTTSASPTGFPSANGYIQRVTFEASTISPGLEFFTIENSALPAGYTMYGFSVLASKTGSPSSMAKAVMYQSNAQCRFVVEMEASGYYEITVMVFIAKVVG